MWIPQIEAIEWRSSSRANVYIQGNGWVEWDYWNGLCYPCRGTGNIASV